jgi:hypothetical protein
MALLGSAMPDPQSKAAAPPEGGRLAGIQPDGDQPEQSLRSTLSPLLAVGSLFCSLRISRLGE